MTALFIAFAAACVSALVLVPVSRTVAHRLGYVAEPRTERWHKRPTPLLGGVALSASVLGLMPLFGAVRPVWVLLLSAGAMSAVGLADDVRSLKPSTKLVAQVAVASLLVFFGYRLGWVESLTGDTLLTLLWVVGITNAFNLLDNMDGLCAGVALIAGVSLLAAYGGGSVDHPAVIYLTLLLGASAGFLVYNVHPASVFLGDSGSLFIGVSLAGLALGLGGATDGQPNILAVIAVPAFVLLIPIFDTTLVTLSRIVSGRTPATGGLDHSSHRLVAIGLSERAAVFVLWALAGVGGAVGVLARYVSPDWSLLIAALVLLAMAVFAVYLAQVRVDDEDPDRTSGNGRVTPLVADFLFTRGIAEVVLDACLVSVAYYTAYRLRFEGEDWGQNFGLFLQSLPIVVGVQTVALFIAGAYRGVWRYFTLIDGLVFVKGVLAGTAGAVAVLVFGYRFALYSRTVFAIYAVILVVLLIGSRSSFRLISDLIRRRRHAGERVVVYGAGDVGVAAMRQLFDAPQARFRMVGFIDDDRARHGRRVHGYVIHGGYEQIVALIDAGKVDAVVLAAAPLDGARVTALRRHCESRGVTLSRVHVGIERLDAG